MAKKSAVVSEIIDNIRRVFQVVNEKSKKATIKTGLTGPQLWAIKTIAELSPVRVSDLARRMYLHPATVVGMLNRLELQGLIKRLRTNDDRRIVNVELTNAGNMLVAKNATSCPGFISCRAGRITSCEIAGDSCGFGRTGPYSGGSGTSATVNPFTRG